MQVLFGTFQVAVTSVNTAGVAGSAEIAAYPDQLELISGVSAVPARAVPPTRAMPATTAETTSLRIAAR